MGTTIQLTPTVAPTVALQPTVAGQVVLTPTIGTQGVRGIQGIQGPTGSGGDLSSVFTQSIASATWVVPVPAGFIAVGKVPAVTVYDTAGTNIVGGYVYDPVGHTLTLTFTAPFAGTASLN